MKSPFEFGHQGLVDELTMKHHRGAPLSDFGRKTIGLGVRRAVEFCGSVVVPGALLPSRAVAVTRAERPDTGHALVVGLTFDRSVMGSARCTLMYTFEMANISVSEARAALPEVLDRVLAGEEVTITRHGKAVAVVVRPDAIRVRRADRALGDAERLRDLLAEARAIPLSDTPVLSAERAQELVASVRANRSEN